MSHDEPPTCFNLKLREILNIKWGFSHMSEFLNRTYLGVLVLVIGRFSLMSIIDDEASLGRHLFSLWPLLKSFKLADITRFRLTFVGLSMIPRPRILIDDLLSRWLLILNMAASYPYDFRPILGAGNRAEGSVLRSIFFDFPLDVRK